LKGKDNLAAGEDGSMVLGWGRGRGALTQRDVLLKKNQSPQERGKGE